MNEKSLDYCFFAQLHQAATICRSMSKNRMLWELSESNRLLSKNAKQIFELGERIKRLEAALNEIIQLEVDISVGCYGFGDIAREALKNEKGA